MIKKFFISDNTNLYRYGTPIETGATIINLKDFNSESTDKIEDFNLNINEQFTILNKQITEETYIWGLGETLGSLNKKGRKYEFFATDDPEHTPDKNALYASHAFFIVEDNDEVKGYFIDFPGRINFDIGFSNFNSLNIEIFGKDFDFYCIKGDTKLEIIQCYLDITGTPYVPPKWAFGFGQSRWSYPDEKSIRSIAKEMRNNKIPCDSIYMDIDYMENYKVFTVDKNKFPNFKKFVQDMKNDGFNLIPIVDPGVKIEENYSVYEEGAKNNYYCKDKNGNNFIAAVWPGFTNFPDFLNSSVREWWGKKYNFFKEFGINAFWNDMNEPSIFYTPESLKEIFSMLNTVTNDYVNSQKSEINIFEIKDKIMNIAGNKNYYKTFYHNLDNGEKKVNEDVHNLYGFNMARATAEGLRANNNDRYFLLSRSSYSGQHRYSSIWYGDNKSWWEHMLLNIRMMQSTNMSGFFYSGADTGGFGSNTSPELIVRWTQLGAFSPLFRNHSAYATRNQEPWAFGENITKKIKDIIDVRYALIPYAYSEFMKSVLNKKPFILPLNFVFEDDIVNNIEDQYMYGDSIMVAPIYKQNEKGRFVHLPTNKWLGWKVSNWKNRAIEVYDAGDYYINCELNEIPIFIKENSMIVMTEPEQYVKNYDYESLNIIAFVTDEANYTYYVDDGKTYSFEDDVLSLLNIKIKKTDEEYEIEIEKDESENLPLKTKKINFEIYDEYGNSFSQEVDL